MKRQPAPARAKFLLFCGTLTLGVAALIFVLLRSQADAEKSRNEFIDFVRSAADASRTNNLPEMRRLYLNDAFLEDAALRQTFADFGRLREEDFSKLEPDYEGDSYCWLSLPGSHARHKLVRAQGAWVIQGDVVPLDR